MTTDERVRIELRPIATPLPLTFSGLLIASIVISGYELGWVPSAQQHTTGWVLLAVPLPLQLLAATWGFVARSAAAATGSAVLAAAWIAFALDLITARPGPPGPSNALAMLFLGAAGSLVVPILAELRVGTLLPGAVLATTAARFVLTGVSGLTHRVGWVHASGYAGLVVVAAAFYGALALELESTTQTALVPTFRVGRARSAVSGSLEQQLSGLENEAGVRSVV